MPGCRWNVVTDHPSCLVERHLFSPLNYQITTTSLHAACCSDHVDGCSSMEHRTWCAPDYLLGQSFQLLESLPRSPDACCLALDGRHFCPEMGSQLATQCYSPGGGLTRRFLTEGLAQSHLNLEEPRLATVLGAHVEHGAGTSSLRSTSCHPRHVNLDGSLLSDHPGNVAKTHEAPFHSQSALAAQAPHPHLNNSRL